MKNLPFMRWISSRLHLAMGLAALAVGVVLGAAYLKLIPDGEALTRQHRGSLSETIAITVSSMLDETQPQDLQSTLGFLRERNPDLLSVGVRSQPGDLLIDVNDHAAHWVPGPRAASLPIRRSSCRSGRRASPGARSSSASSPCVPPAGKPMCRTRA